MAKNTQHIPYTEMQERVIEIGRIPIDSKLKVRGMLQDVYLREIATKYDWDFLLTTSSFTSEQQYNTGSISATTQNTTVSFSGAVITSGMTGHQLKISGVDGDFDFTYVSSSDGTVRPAVESTSNISGASFWLSKRKYPLAEEFDRFPKNGGIYYYQGAQRIRLKYKYYDNWNSEFSNTPSANPDKFRLAEVNTANQRMVEIGPPPSVRKIFYYDYIRQLPPMKENSAGTVTIGANNTTVTGVDTQFTQATTGDWLRVYGSGADSEWYQILSIENDSSLTLKSAFGNSGALTSNYVISSCAELPPRLQPAVMYGALRAVAADTNDDNLELYQFQYEQAIKDCKRIFLTNDYNQEFDTVSTDYLYRR